MVSVRRLEQSQIRDEVIRANRTVFEPLWLERLQWDAGTVRWRGHQLGGDEGERIPLVQVAMGAYRVNRENYFSVFPELPRPPALISEKYGEAPITESVPPGATGSEGPIRLYELWRLHVLSLWGET